MAKDYMTRSRPKDSTNQTTAIGWKFRDELDEAKKVQIKEQCQYIVTTPAEQAAAGQAPFDMFIVAGDLVMIAPNDQFCMGTAATFLNVFRDEQSRDSVPIWLLPRRSAQPTPKRRCQRRRREAGRQRPAGSERDGWWDGWCHGPSAAR